MVKWLVRLIQLFKINNKEEIKNILIEKEQKISVGYKLTPTLRETIIDMDWLERCNRIIEYIILHHSTTNDGVEISNWDAIDIYHRSFRMNYEIIVKPVTDLNLLSNIEKGVEKNYMKIYDSWYCRIQLITFYKEAMHLMEQEILVPNYISEFVKGVMIETPWRKIGYNLGIEWARGKVSLCYGRSLMEDGAHCYQLGINKKSIGILTVGNFDKNYPDSEIWRKNILVCREIIKKHPKAIILGHREVKGVKKSCPGELWDMEQFRRDVLNKTI